MGRAEHDVNRLRMVPEDRGEGLDDVLDPLVGREKPERQDHGSGLDAEVVFAAFGVRSGGDSVRNHVDLAGIHAVHLAQKRGRVFAHHDESASTALTLRKSLARRYDARSLSAISKRTRAGYA